MICTWKECTEEASCKQYDRCGNVWANLCQAHHDKLEKSINNLDPDKKDSIKHHLGCWVKASGGAEKIVKEMFGGKP